MSHTFILTTDTKITLNENPLTVTAADTATWTSIHE